MHNIILKPEDRSPEVPAETAKTPLECWVKGWALEEARIGERLQIRTPAGRTVEGTLTTVNPGYTHSFGPSIPELGGIGEELRKLLREGKSGG